MKFYKILFSFFMLFFFSLNLISQKVNDNNLIAYFPFNNNCNDVGYLQKKVINSGSKISKDRFNQNNSCFYFNGINDFMLIKNEIKETDLSQTSSIFAWIKPESPNGTIIEFSGLDNKKLKLCIQKYKNQNLLIAIFSGQFFLDSNIITIDSISANVIKLNEWAYIGFTYHYCSGTFILWYNAQKVASIKLSSLSSLLYNNIFIGKSKNSKNYFQGYIDDICFYSSKVEEDIILENYEAKPKPEIDFIKENIYSAQIKYNLKFKLKSQFIIEYLKIYNRDSLILENKNFYLKDGEETLQFDVLLNLPQNIFYCEIKNKYGITYSKKIEITYLSTFENQIKNYPYNYEFNNINGEKYYTSLEFFGDKLIDIYNTFPEFFTLSSIKKIVEKKNNVIIYNFKFQFSYRTINFVLVSEGKDKKYFLETSDGYIQAYSSGWCRNFPSNEEFSKYFLNKNNFKK